MLQYNKIEKQMKRYKEEQVANISSIWILLLSIAMILSAIGDTGFAFSTAYGPESVQRDVWIWNIIYNADHLCLAAALIGYGSLFSFRKQDSRSDSKRIRRGIKRLKYTETASRFFAYSILLSGRYIRTLLLSGVFFV